MNVSGREDNTTRKFNSFFSSNWSSRNVQKPRHFSRIIRVSPKIISAEISVIDKEIFSAFQVEMTGEVWKAGKKQLCGHKRIWDWKEREDNCSLEKMEIDEEWRKDQIKHPHAFFYIVATSLLQINECSELWKVSFRECKRCWNT